MTDYKQILIATATKLMQLERQRDSIDVEIAKQKQFFYATLNVLPEEERGLGKEMQELLATRDEGLKEAVRRVLMAADGWLTVAMVRDRLEQTGFDFGKYTAAPLPSIGTTLKRLPESEVERSELDGVAAYRWFKPPRGIAAGLKNLDKSTDPKKAILATLFDGRRKDK